MTTSNTNKCVYCDRPVHYGRACDEVKWVAGRYFIDEPKPETTTPVTQTEFRVREITRYIVTRHEQSTTGVGTPVGSTTRELGEYTSYEIAYEVAYALAQAESERLGLTPGDDRVVYPKPVAPSSTRR